MTYPEWTKPGAYGALAGAALISIFGFSVGGWTTGSNAEKMAAKLAKQEVTLAMLPLCVEMASNDPARATKIATIEEASGFSRRKAVMDTGWATLPGTEEPNRDLAAACLDALEIGS